MAEQYPSDSDLNALSGTTGASGLPHMTTGEAPHYTWWHKLNDWLDRIVAATGGALRLYKDGDLTFGVRPGRFLNGASAVNYSGATGQALTDDDTNYVYLTAAGALTVNVTGFPSALTTPHLPLAAVAVGSESEAGVSGEYNVEDITDYRGRCVILPSLGLSAAELHDAVPQIDLSGTDDGDGTGSMDLQVQDAAGGNLAERCLLRVWIADAEYSEPDAQTDFSVTTGEQMRELEADADYEVITDAAGAVSMNIDTATNKTVWVMAELDGRIHTASIAITGN